MRPLRKINLPDLVQMKCEYEASRWHGENKLRSRSRVSHVSPEILFRADASEKGETQFSSKYHGQNGDNVKTLQRPSWTVRIAQYFDRVTRIAARLNSSSGPRLELQQAEHPIAGNAEQPVVLAGIEAGQKPYTRAAGRRVRRSTATDTDRPGKQWSPSDRKKRDQGVTGAAGRQTRQESIAGHKSFQF